MLHEPEVTEPVNLVDTDGYLNSLAIGWMRRPLINSSGINGKQKWGRNKRWEYWNVITPTHILALTISSIDYAGIYEVWVYDRRSGRSWGETRTELLKSTKMPPSLSDENTRVISQKIAIAIDEFPTGTRLRAKIPGASFDIFTKLPPQHERLGVVVPWSRELFQYTVKDICRPACGWVETTGNRVHCQENESWAVLDHGRGRWPREISWNWGAASGLIQPEQVLLDQEYLEEHPRTMGIPHTVGIQMGAKWTDGTGITENSIFLDGAIYKISEDIMWNYDLSEWKLPWMMKSKSVNLVFTPEYNKKSYTDLKVVSSRTDQCFGTYQGVIRVKGVGKILVTDLYGWAEDVHNLW